MCNCIGAAETVNKLKMDYGLKIGCSTGFVRSMVNILLEESAKAGYIPDTSVASDEVPQVNSQQCHPFTLSINFLMYLFTTHTH